MNGIPVASDPLRAVYEWAKRQDFVPEHVDCTTAVVLKILDGKCKMSAEEKNAVLAVYDAVKSRPGERLDAGFHQVIFRGRQEQNRAVMEAVHEHRVEAEARIPKPVMKAYKAFLRRALFA